MPSDYFLKLDGIDSDGVEHRHEKWIPVLGFQYDIKQVRRGLASDNVTELHGSVSFSGLTIIKRIDETTPQLHGACITHMPIKTGQLDLMKATRAGNHVYMSYIFTKIGITSIGHTAEQPTDPHKLALVPTEQITLVFDKCEWSVTPYNEDGRPGATRKYMWIFGADKRT